MNLGCEQCGTYAAHEPCPDCGQIQHIGAAIQCPHDEKAQPSKGFEPFFHVGFGQMVTGLGDINAACRPKWENDHLVKLEVRDRPAGFDADLRARREERRERAMRGQQ